MKSYEIWLGCYHLGQGHHGSRKPEKVAFIEAPNFKVACLLYELRSKLSFIEKLIENNQYVEHQTCRWFYNFNTNSNAWTGKYYESEKEALRSFK